MKLKQVNELILQRILIITEGKRKKKTWKLINESSSKTPAKQSVRIEFQRPRNNGTNGYSRSL